MTELFRKEVAFDWMNEINMAFEQLKKRFMQIPIFIYFDKSRRFRIELDVSTFAIGTIFSQLADDGQ